MKYYSGKGFTVIAAIVFIVIMAIISFVDKAYVVSGVLIAATIYLIWIWYDTYYVVDGSQLFYKSGLLKGCIEISAIVEIIRNKRAFIGKKPSLSTKGIIIKYNKYDDIYVSPKDMDQFIEMLKHINPEIKITN